MQKVGDFEAAQLEQFLKVKDGFRVDIASVTGTPLHYLCKMTGGFPSGESLKKPRPVSSQRCATGRRRSDKYGRT
ncbi:MAG: hypothetical protein IPK98_11120 [Chloracidobacterium sp.]|nr:hypothetical protein [Chloracidobacterium sp.]